MSADEAIGGRRWLLVLGLAALTLLALVMIWVVDPYQAASSDLRRVYTDEAAASSFPQDLAITAIWLVASGLIAFFFARWVSLKRRSVSEWVGVAALAAGLIMMGTFVPGFIVGLSLISNAEAGGYYNAESGLTALVAFQALGLLLAIAGVAFMFCAARVRRSASPNLL